MDELGYGKQLYVNNCANCHNLVTPTDHSKEAWAPILVIMQKEARISDGDMALITNYIHSEIK